MGQKSSSCTMTTNRGDSNATRTHRGGGCPLEMIPTEPVDMEPTPLAAAETAHTRCSWLSATESALTSDWQEGRRKQQRGIAGTSPHVRLTCAAATFPENRTTAIVHSLPPTNTAAAAVATRRSNNDDDDSGDVPPVTDIPVGMEYFLALRAAWRKEATPQAILPATDLRDLDDSLILSSIEEPVGKAMWPPVPLSYMVSEILVPQWDAGGLYDEPHTRRNR
ncbi:hypothetical protein DQ04_09251010 [Trypanosoma grayi]|uniref:hypothetical protein n=1 Tax=Trypanosoma grayi TaxID=71804 RepID=UPI0004F47F66|nr:hypothetical protein DQ04_09251010 [Trypanosoma grayi]KEG07622.1 hypothetical protein DQ04_09251010 [Trypanosoma grayi]